MQLLDLAKPVRERWHHPVGNESQKQRGARRDREMATAADTRFIVMGTDDLLAYTKDTAVKVKWKRDAGWGDTMSQDLSDPSRPSSRKPASALALNVALIGQAAHRDRP